MNKTLAITTLALVAVVMIVSTIIPAMAVITSGVIVSINPSDRHGVIERTDDDSGTLYQFSIPRDLADSSNIPNVGDVLFFIIDPENSRHATNVGICIPPQCNG